MKSVRSSLQSLMISKSESSIIIMDDSVEEYAQSNEPRDFLAQLIKDHEDLFDRLPTSLLRLNPGQWLNDEIIDIYLSRILQPISDFHQHKIVFLSTQVYELLKRDGSGNQSVDQHFNKYNIGMVETYVMICNTPGHWVTVIIKIDLETQNAHFSYYDSLVNQINLNDNLVVQISNLFTRIYECSFNWSYDCLQQKMQDNCNDCGVWALLFAESTINSYRKPNELPFPNVTNERIRILSEIKELLDLSY